MNIDEAKKKLEAEKVNLEESLRGLGNIVNKKTGDWQATPEDGATREADENDLADKFEDFEERSAKMEALETRFRDVVAALENIKNDTFGKCEKCGKPIEEDRLEANPAARICKEHME